MDSPSVRIFYNLLEPSAPDEGISYGGEGSDDDDPSAKEREETEYTWGSLW